MSAASAYLIYEDRQGILWIGTDGGVSILDDKSKPFQHYRSIPGNPTSLSHNNVRSIHASRAEVVWIGTNGGGLNKFDRQTIDFENRYIHKDGSIRHLSWMATPLPDEERVYAVARDITERKKAERELKEHQNRLKALASQLTIVEEKERRRISADLHDHVGQSLALARVQLAAASKSTSESKLADKLDDISDTLFKALEDTQKLMLELSSSSIHEIGLSSAISEWLENQIGNRHGLKTEFTNNLPDHHRKTLGANVRAILFRNVRELLVNVVKHARANKVSVRIEDRGSSIRIIVEDDGIGFETHAGIHTGREIGGFGLFRIEELMADLDGNLKIVSAPGKGCTAILSAPFSVDVSRERD